MFLEKCGLLFFYKMRPLFFFTILLFPILGAAFFVYSTSSKISFLEERFLATRKKEKYAIECKNRKERFLSRYSNTDLYFLDREIKNIDFLRDEKKYLLSLQKHPGFPTSSKVEERIEFFKENKLVFREEKIESTSQIKETEEKGRHSVQVNERDLQNLLCLIEDLCFDHLQSKRPQLLVKNFRLKKMISPLQTEIFDLKIDLIKREYSI